MTKEQKYQNIIDGKTKITDQMWFTIIMLIIFFPYGLYLMWKKNKFNKTIRIIITLFFVICFIIGLKDYKHNNAVYKNEDKIIAERGTKDKSNVITLEYGIAGEYGKKVIFDGNEEIEFFIPYGKYEIISKRSKVNKIYIVSDSTHINDSGFTEEDSVQEIDISKEKTFYVNEGQHLFLTLTTKIEIQKMEEN
jgi:hypothetical protein